MQIYDISVPLSSATPTYPGDPPIEIRPWLRLAAGDSANVSLLYFGAHSGTHVDAPAHFIEGTRKSDSLSLESLVGPAEVVEVPASVDVIDEDFVTEKCSGEQQRVLFKTRNSGFWSDIKQGFRNDFTYLSGGAAERLAQMGLQLVGIDYLSVERFQSQKFEAHHALLSREVVVLEGLDLRAVNPGRYELICLPLKIADGSGDGAPARAILRSLS